MKKSTKIRNVFTDEMMSVIRNHDLTDAQVGAVIRQIVYPGEFDTTDTMAKVFAQSFFMDYMALTLSCAETKLKEVERLNKHYSSPKVRMPEWFPRYYANSRAYYANIIEVLTNVIEMGANVCEHYKSISDALDNVPLTFAIYNRNTNTNTNTNTNDTDTDIPPKSPEGDCGACDPHVAFVAWVEGHEAFGQMRVNRGKLIRCMASLYKRNMESGRDDAWLETRIREGLEAWTRAWKDDGWRYSPGRITDWLYDEKYLETPRKKEAARDDGAYVAAFEEVGVKEIV